MATKYVREGGVREARLERETPYRPFQRTWRLNPRRRLLIIYVAILGICMLLFTVNALSRKMPFKGQPVIRGAAEVLDKSAPEEPHRLRITVPVTPARTVDHWTPVDAETWEDFTAGDYIGVLYQVSRDGQAVRIRETGLVALPPPKP